MFETTQLESLTLNKDLSADVTRGPVKVLPRWDMKDFIQKALSCLKQTNKQKKSYEPDMSWCVGGFLASSYPLAPRVISCVQRRN